MAGRNRADERVSVLGILLAAGQGTRMGQPKALVRGADGVPWLVSSREALVEGGCDRVVVVLGAEAGLAAELLGGHAHVVADDWGEGMSATLRAGLRIAEGGDEEAVLIHLVDLPDVGSEVIRRILAHAAPDALVRAAYDDHPGHPVLIGEDHWRALMASLGGDEGAKHYLARHRATLVECADLATGVDIDTPAEYEAT